MSTRIRAIHNCQACGALSGELHDDQCPECRAAPGKEHHPDCKFPESGNMGDSGNPPVNIPLAIQERLFDEAVGVVMNAAIDLIGGGYDGDIVDLARSRLRSGFDEFGSAMYTWSPERRRQEVLEELADALVYLTSGPIE